MAHPWKDLIVWQKAHELVLETYRLSEKFPESERFGLSQQTRRAATSVVSNIVEGKSKRTDKEFKTFLFNSRGSLEELRYQIFLASQLKYIEESDLEYFENKAKNVSFLLNRLINSVEK
ncbi:MAG: four helix bundle protein [Bacteroidales bacterium]